jgi:S1-C subfamily serine protease
MLRMRSSQWVTLALPLVTLVMTGMACNLGLAASTPSSTTVPIQTTIREPTAIVLPTTLDTAELAQATVQILALIKEGGDWQPVWSGSGSLFDPEGLILTNAHVVDDRFGEYTELGVAVTHRTDEPPELSYLAEIATIDYDLDLAVIRIVSDLEGEPVSLSLPSVPLGDSGSVEIGDELRILGYPGIGGETITFTRGSVSGFTGDRSVRGRAWIKTDATITGGNSGGMGINAAGELIGIPTIVSSGSEAAEVVDCRPLADTNRDGTIDESDTCVPIGGFINALRPINLARPLIEAARGGEAYFVDTQAQPPAEGGFEPDRVSLYDLVFADGVTEDDRPSQIWYALPGGANEVCGFWSYEGMADGVTWSAYWFVDGELNEGGSNLGDTWVGGVTGDWWVCIYNDAGLADGLYELVLEVEGEALISDSVFVGGDQALVDFTVENQAGVAITYVFLSPSIAQNWGQDELGPDEIIPPGGSRAFVVPSGTYDLLMQDSEFDTLAEEYGLDLNSDESYRLED